MRKGAYGLVAALAAVVAVGVGCDSTESVPAGQPSGSTTAPEAAAQVGTMTFDGSKCSLEITADRIEAGVVSVEVVNATEKRAMFDSYELQEGYSFRAFEGVVGKMRRSHENGKLGHGWPSEREVRYLSSDIVPRNSSGSIVESVLPGRHAIVCMQPYEVFRGRGDFGPFGIAGPIVVR